jgi:hypothetical protein
MHELRAAREEAVLACDLLNERRPRSLDAFVAHMLRAWLHLFAALAAKEHRSNERRGWALEQHLAVQFPDENDAVRANVEFFVAFQKRIAHRFSPARLALVEEIVAGKIAALLVNFERTMVGAFGIRSSLAQVLRFPIAIASLDGGAGALRERAYERAPASLLRFVESYDERVGGATRASESYDFRIYLMPKAAPTERDLPIEFVDLSTLSSEEAAAVENARVIIRDRQIEAINVNRLKASEVVARLQSTFPAFSLYYHTLAWRHYGIRPSANAADPTRTDPAYALYDRAHRDYLYTEAWVERLREALGDDPQRVVDSWKPSRE